MRLIRQDARAGFTLIELLIIIAILGTLTAVAVPNFLEAHTRARVSRAKGEMRAIATALEMYTVDRGGAPRGNDYQLSTRFSATRAGDKGLILLSTPIAYLEQGLMRDAFPTTYRYTSTYVALDKDPERIWYKSSARDSGGTVGTYGPPDRDIWSTRVHWWVLQSSGPGQTRYTLGSGVIDPDRPQDLLNRMYDPTNGTQSYGGIFRVGGTPAGEAAGLAFSAIPNQH